MNKKKKAILFSGVLLTSLGCGKADGTLLETENDRWTGPLISGIYGFDSYDELRSFYSIYEIKNTEEFLLIDLDDLGYRVEYYFISGGVNSEVIYKKIYDYDFPSPSFKIAIGSMDLKLSDISETAFPSNPTHSVEVETRGRGIQYRFFIGNCEVGLLQSEDTLETAFIDCLSGKFLGALKNV